MRERDIFSALNPCKLLNLNQKRNFLSLLRSARKLWYSGGDSCIWDRNLSFDFPPPPPFPPSFLLFLFVFLFPRGSRRDKCNARRCRRRHEGAHHSRFVPHAWRQLSGQVWEEVDFISLFKNSFGRTEKKQRKKKLEHRWWPDKIFGPISHLKSRLRGKRTN